MAEVRALRTSASEYLRRGVEARDSGHRAEAIRLHRRAVEEDPTLSQAHVNLVILYGTEGRAADAERQYREAAESGAESAELHYNFGVVAYSGGQPAVAKRAFRDALTMNPEHALANHNMGQMHEEEGRFAEAMASYRRALEAQPAHALSHYKIGMLWSRERNAPEAVRSFEAAIGEDSDRRPTYLYSLAAALLASGNRAAAAQRFREARREAARYQQPELARQAERALVAMGVGTDARSR